MQVFTSFMGMANITDPTPVLTLDEKKLMQDTMKKMCDVKSKSVDQEKEASSSDTAEASASSSAAAAAKPATKKSKIDTAHRSPSPVVEKAPDVPEEVINALLQPRLAEILNCNNQHIHFTLVSMCANCRTHLSHMYDR
jgi:DNA replication initiation complex subunit (GINS family)